MFLGSRGNFLGAGCPRSTPPAGLARRVDLLLHPPTEKYAILDFAKHIEIFEASYQSRAGGAPY